MNTPIAGLTRSDLLAAEDYLIQREAFRARVLERQQARTIPLGAHASLAFEDRLSVRLRVQEMLRLAPELTEALIESALIACRSLLPDGHSLTASLRIAFAAEGALAPAQLAGIEQRVYAEVEGLGRNFAAPVKPPFGGEVDDDDALPLLRFRFTLDQITSLRAGAEFGFGIDDPRMRVGHTLKRASRAALLADFDGAEREDPAD